MNMESSRLAPRRSSAALLSSFLAAAGTVGAQCGLQYQPLTRLAGASGPVLASCLWDPDGAGPLPTVVVLGGAFGALCNQAVNGIATYDPATGIAAAIGSGPGIAGPSAPEIRAVCATGSHGLVVAGRFTSIDGYPATNVARWDGISWKAMGAGLPFDVNALIELPGGEVIAGGSNVMSWDGSNWSPLAGWSGTALAFARLSNGDLLVGGDAMPSNLMRWNGNTWTLFPGAPNAFVSSLLVVSTGELIAGGGFTQIGGIPAHCIARWDGNAWAALGSGFGYACNALAETSTGHIIAAGAFIETGGVRARRVARWDGTFWAGLGTGLGGPVVTNIVEAARTVTVLPNDDLIVGGAFASTSGDFDRVARWDGAAWRQLTPGTNGVVRGTAEAGNGDLIAVGDFTIFEGVPANRVVRRSGGVWQAMGTGPDGPVRTVINRPNGDVVIGGDFTSVSGVAASRVARWDGTNWHPLGAGLPGMVTGFANDAGGKLLALGAFVERIVVWDGQAWHGTGIANAVPGLRWMLGTGPDGAVIGTIAISMLGRWDGQAWQPLAPFATVFNKVCVLERTGTVLVAGNSVRRVFPNGNSVLVGAPFNGEIQSIVTLPDGGIVVGGAFTANGTTPLPRLARWNGTAWAPFGIDAADTVEHLRWSGDGRLIVAGAMSVAQGGSTGPLGSISSPCPAGVAALGSGCAGSGGMNVLTATELPWIGGAFRSRAHGLPASGLIVEALGLGAIQQPLASVLPQAGPACELLVLPDLLRAYGAAASLDLALALPHAASLIGASFVQQLVPLELGLSGDVLLATSSNALQATIGAF